MNIRSKGSIVLLFLFCATLLNVISAYGQISYGGSPKKKTQYKSTQLTVSRVQMPKFDVQSYSQKNINISKYKSLKFAHGFKVKLNTQNSGQWSDNTDGSRTWRLRIFSENAKSLNIIFSRFKLPPGGRVFISNVAQTYFHGGFTDANHSECINGQLCTMPIPGDEIEVIYEEPLYPLFEAALEIGKVNHDFLDLFAILPNYKSGLFGDSDTCEVNINCQPDFEKEKRAVAKLIINGETLCSCTLLNNTAENGRPLALSAGHCYTEYDFDATATLFVFNYESPNCDLTDIEGSREQSVAGATMRARSKTGENLNLDFVLLEMSVNPPHEYRPYYLGWNITNSLPTSSVSIHHPEGDVKKIAMDNQAPKVTTLNMDNTKFYAQGHFEVYQWDLGITEGGSSGAALLNQNRQVVGGLSAGLASCINPQYDYYFRFSKAWDAYPETQYQLKHWLDPLSTGATSLNGYEPVSVQKIKKISNVDNSKIISAKRLPSTYKGFLAGHNSLKTQKIAEKFHFDLKQKLYGVSFVAIKGQHSETNPVAMVVWSGDSIPRKELYRQPVVIKQWANNQNVTAADSGTVGGWTSIKRYYHNQESYLKLTNELVVQGDIFVGFEFQYGALSSDTFALFMANNKFANQINTAFYYKDSQWKPFTSYPNQTVGSSLWVNVVAGSEIFDTTNTFYRKGQKTIVIPNPSNGNINIKIKELHKKALGFMVYNLSGQLVYASSIYPTNLYPEINLSFLKQGIYILKLSSPTISDYHRIIIDN